MNTSHRVYRAVVRCVRSVLCLGLACLLASAIAVPAVAQSGSAGRISGRIFNPATQQYVRNAEIRVAGTDLVAYSGDDGSYVLTNVAPGEIGLTVTYTGYDVASAKVNVGADATVTRDFELQGSTYQSAGAAAGKKEGEIITLSSFVVSSE